MNKDTFTLSNLVRVLAVLAILLGVVFMTAPVTAEPHGSIIVDPTSGSPGARVIVTGSFPGYGSMDTVVLWWDTLYQGRFLGSVNLRSDGSFSLPVIIPPEAYQGEHKIYADVNYGYDQASVDFTVTEPARSAVYIYDGDEQAAGAYQSWLNANGITTTLLQMDGVANANFSPFDLILAGPDTGFTDEWGTADAVARVYRSGKPILGLGEGGYALFGKGQLAIGYPHGYHPSENQIYVVDPAHPVFNAPNDIYIPRDRLLTLYATTSASVMIYMPEPPADVGLIGLEVGSQQYYGILQQSGRYMLWGFQATPDSMTQIGRDLLINIIDYLIWIGTVDTLVLTDYARMEDIGYSHADVVGLENDLNNLIGLPKSTTNMVATHKDLSDDGPSQVQTDCGNWDGNEGDVDATNDCVGAIDAYIEQLKQSGYVNLSYVILVGAHEVIPMKVREQDHLISAQERLWGAGLPAPDSYMHQLYSEPGTVNGWGHYLTDTIYADLSYINDGWGGDRELVPELAVGRMVETPAQIGDQIDVYIDANAYFSRTDRVSIASNDYVDGGTLAADYMDPGADDALVQNTFASTDVPPKLNALNDLAYIGGHGDYNSISTGSSSFMAGNHATRGDTADLNDMPNAVIVTSGCHNGVNFGNQLFHAPDAGTTYSEFPEEFADRQAGVYVGATGYTIISNTNASTDVSQTRHNEKLSTYVIKHLDQDGCISAGEAFRRAVNSYLTDVGGFGTMERRVIAITTLYGIPNYRGSCLLYPVLPRIYEYYLDPWWVDPPPYLDPGIFRLRVELLIRDWTIRFPNGGPHWYLEILGANYGGMADEPLIPVLKTGVVLPPGSIVQDVVWDQAASQRTTWVADGPMYIPLATEDPLNEILPASVDLPAFQHQGLFPEEPYSVYATTTSGGAGTQVGLSINPLQHDSQTLDTTLWTTMAFTMTIQTGPATDADGDGLPTYWELSHGLDPNDASGNNGAGGNPDNDDLANSQEFDNTCNPQDPDSDDDGWSDGEEVSFGTNPRNPGSHPWLLFLPLSAKD